MFTRLTHIQDQEKKGAILPQQWLDSARLTLDETYEKECEKEQGHFFVYGEVYENELLLITSFTKDPTQLPTSCFMSCDLEEKSKHKALLATLLNFSSLFWDEFFQNKAESEYFEVWTETELENLKFFYKISRENIELSLQADALLDQKVNLN